MILFDLIWNRDLGVLFRCSIGNGVAGGRELLRVVADGREVWELFQQAGRGERPIHEERHRRRKRRELQNAALARAQPLANQAHGWPFARIRQAAQ
jgi:hypothetical protein